MISYMSSWLTQKVAKFRNRSVGQGFTPARKPPVPFGDGAFFVDKFDRPDTNYGDPLGNDWVESVPGTYRIVNGTLQCNSTSLPATGPNETIVYRPCKGKAWTTGKVRLVYDFDGLTPGASVECIGGIGWNSSATAAFRAVFARITGNGGAFISVVSAEFFSTTVGPFGLGTLLTARSTPLSNTPIWRVEFLWNGTTRECVTTLYDISDPLHYITCAQFTGTAGSGTYAVANPARIWLGAGKAITQVAVYDGWPDNYPWSSQTIAYNDAAIHLSPATFVDTGTEWRTNCCGAYAKVCLPGRRIDILLKARAAATNLIVWRIDGGRLQFHELNYNYYQMTLGQNLDNKLHSVEVWFGSVRDVSTDRWGASSVNFFELAGFKIDSGAGSAVAFPNLPTKTCLSFGDSLGERAVNAPLTGEGAGSARQAWPALLAAKFGWDLGQIHYSYMGFTFMLATTAVPSFFTNVGGGTASHYGWQSFYSGVSRLSGAVAIFQPDYIMLMLGQNDLAFGTSPNTNVPIAIAAGMPVFRTAYPATKIFVIITITGALRSVVTTAMNTYIATGDSNCILIDPGMSIGDYESYDGLHPTDKGNGQVADRIAPLLAPLL